MNTVGFAVVTCTFEISKLHRLTVTVVQLSNPNATLSPSCFLLISMHRAIGRVFRGQCRKFRENDCPVAAGEDVRRNNKDDERKFVPPIPPTKHTLEEAVVWTTGLALGYHMTHGRRRHSLIEKCSTPSALSPGGVTTRKISAVSPREIREKSPCVFTSLTSKVSEVFAQPSTSLSVNARRTSTVITSIDVTPFMHDDAQECELPEMISSPNTLVDDDDIVFGFDSSESTHAESTSIDLNDRTSLILKNPAEYGTKFGADLLSVQGAFEFLQEEAKAKSGVRATSKKTGKKLASKGQRSRTNSTSSSQLTSKNPPIHAMTLMKHGAELGSARAMYNVGVAYDRMNDPKIAREYYKRAADLGHPLAIYNCAVFALKDGHLSEGYALMKTASDFGVLEAKEFMKPTSGKSVTSFQVPVGQT